MDGGKGIPQTDNWLQRLLAQGLELGIGKSELLNAYYLDEFMALIDEWNLMHGTAEAVEEEVALTPMAFFAMR